MTSIERRLTTEEDDDDRSDMPEDDVEMGFFEHLTELRGRVIKIVYGMIPGVVIGWIFKEHILEFLAAPIAEAMRSLGQDQPTLHLASPVDGFLVYLKLSLVAGLLLSTPWTFWQIWAFISPGLYRKEKRIAIPFTAASTVCFAGGAIFGYAVVFPMIFETLLEFAGQLPGKTLDVQPTYFVQEYLGFSVQLLLAFGVVFEVPVVVTFLAVAGFVNWKQLLSFGRWWVLIASVLAAVLTPPDVGSQLLMLFPLVVLYYVSVLIAYFVGKKPEPEG